MPASLYILWGCFAVMFLMSPIGAFIVQRRVDKKKGDKK